MEPHQGLKEGYKIILLVSIISKRYEFKRVNVLLTENNIHILVFSSEGDLIATIGHEGTGPGEFYIPSGIDVDREGRIVVVDHKDTHKLQFF